MGILNYSTSLIHFPGHIHSAKLLIPQLRNTSKMKMIGKVYWLKSSVYALCNEVSHYPQEIGKVTARKTSFFSNVVPCG
jgi:hypothetical protein